MNWQALQLPACGLAESPRYAHGCWAWVDIDQRVLYRLNQSDILSSGQPNLHALELPDEIGCVLPTARAETWVLLGRQGAWLLEHNSLTLKLAAPFDSAKHRFNDGRADPAGRVWISSLVDARSPATAALYCIESGKAELKINDLIVGNGLAFSPQGNSMFLSDTRHKCLWRFDFDSATSVLSNKRLIKQYTEGPARPDGACFSNDGSYWVAILEGYRLERFSEQGEFMENIEIPLAKPTMPCFGGEHGNILLVTSAKADEKLPNKPRFGDVSLIACESGFKGLPESFANPAHLN
ncbi:SMP-30/gluconolactonase/LRE family protein [Limnobacter parvus]|uniref:SMP-30/gluconolactonase/LRE family protein n=1 Tax=Limnobacter parvus TaxID=2939690 RepID=A0ABT1XE03_9BURK|nr:SMP-30/gluconolactonase/LRE family protein [Limnobacter parvus]MCR2745522.1 SMP-30/gluconolactonase/LRE family protein [Limnobacter parvus]